MDSSFLTGIHVCLGLFSFFLFLKLIIQFGLPNHPARFVIYVVSLSVTAYFSMQSLTDLGVVSPWVWMKWSSLPMVAGSLSLLLQVIMMVGNLSIIQQRVLSRLPVMAALLFFAFFPNRAHIFVMVCLVAAFLFLTVSVGKVRYQKRVYFKMFLFLSICFGLKMINTYGMTILADLFLVPALFYFFLFQHSFGVAALVDDYKEALEGSH